MRLLPNKALDALHTDAEKFLFHEGDGVGGSMRDELRAGRQVRQRRGDDGGGDNAGGARRHQEGAVEARGSLGGGGKRGVEE